MRYMIIVRFMDTIVGDLVPPAQQRAATHIQKLLGAGKVSDSGVFVDERAGYLIADVGSEEELFEMASGLLDVAMVEMHPLISFERVGQFFQQLAAERRDTG